MLYCDRFTPAKRFTMRLNQSPTRFLSETSTHRFCSVTNIKQTTKSPSRPSPRTPFFFHLNHAFAKPLFKLPITSPLRCVNHKTTVSSSSVKTVSANSYNLMAPTVTLWIDSSRPEGTARIPPVGLVYVPSQALSSTPATATIRSLT